MYASAGAIFFITGKCFLSLILMLIVVLIIVHYNTLYVCSRAVGVSWNFAFVSSVLAIEIYVYATNWGDVFNDSCDDMKVKAFLQNF